MTNKCNGKLIIWKSLSLKQSLLNGAETWSKRDPTPIVIYDLQDFQTSSQLHDSQALQTTSLPNTYPSGGPVDIKDTPPTRPLPLSIYPVAQDIPLFPERSLASAPEPNMSLPYLPSSNSPVRRNGR